MAREGLTLNVEEKTVDRVNIEGTEIMQVPTLEELMVVIKKQREQPVLLSLTYKEASALMHILRSAIKSSPKNEEGGSVWRVPDGLCFGASIRWCRKRMGFTQAQFAELVNYKGLSQTVLSRIEKSKYCPSYDQFKRVMFVLMIWDDTDEWHSFVSKYEAIANPEEQTTQEEDDSTDIVDKKDSPSNINYSGGNRLFDSSGRLSGSLTSEQISIAVAHTYGLDDD